MSETNFEHYKQKIILEALKAEDYDTWYDTIFDFAFEHGMYVNEDTSDCGIYALIVWLYSTYQYPVYNLSKFEIDLLEAEYNKKFTFYNIPLLMEMQRRGYYKGIPDDVPIEEILKNSICLE